MFSEFRVSSSAGGYDVVVGSGLFTEAVGKADIVIVDEAVRTALPELGVPVLVIEPDEDVKTLAGCERVILAMREAGVRRGHHVFAVGGGVVQDVATFVSDIYMRGLPWSYVPTTLMAMADSCLGGKSSINAGGVKNLVGGIYPPQTIVVDTDFLSTLSATAIAAGLSESVKIAFCRGSAQFQRYLADYPRFDTDPATLIGNVLDCKRWFVQIDEHDRGERRLLNFGHTFGHALESAVDHRISHGLGVAVGVLCAIEHPLAAKGPLVDALANHCRILLERADGVADALATFDTATFERAFRSDKKHSSTAFRVILPAEAGGVAEIEIGVDDAAWATIADVTGRTLASLGGQRR